jgi:hypothetical protein
MEKRRMFGGFGFISLIFCILCAALPVSAQVPQPGEDNKPGPLIRVMVSDLQVQGEQTPEAFREAFNTILPQLADCIEAEYERARRLPNRIMLRFNLSSNGKVVWSKVIDPPLRSLEDCLSKTLLRLQLPPSGSRITRITVLLETRMDHLMAP